MPTRDTSRDDELFTVVENASGVARTFGFLNKRLQPDEVYAVRGDLVATLGAKRSKRDFDAFQRSLSRGSIIVRSRPMPVLWDPIDERAVGLAVQNGVLGTVDPTYSSHVDADYAGV